MDFHYGGGYSRSAPFREWWMARRYLFDREYGVLLRQAEHEERRREADLSRRYDESVTFLKQQQQG